MKVKHFFTVLMVGLMFNFLAAFAGDPKAEKIKQFETYFQENYQEQIYIQVDKEYYLAGEQINLKVFCIEASESKPSKLSKVAYVEVLDSENSPKLQVKILLQDGAGYGDIFIPTNLISGNYIIRGYTRWMKNFEPDSYFHSMTTIINPFRKLGLKPKRQPEDITLDFYPESGKLVDGIESKVVFECKDSNGIPVIFCGKILDNEHTVVTEFCSSKNGLGSFNFTPDINKKYRAEIMCADSVLTSHKVPKIHESGIALVVKDKGNNFEIGVYGKGEMSNEDFLFYLIHSHGKIINSKSITLKNNSSISSIESDILPGGVSTITLFSSTGIVLCNRSFFKPPRVQDILKIDISKQSSGTREKVSIDISSLINELSPEEMNLSVSVASHHEQFNRNQLRLSDYLLLGRSLDGYVYNLEPFFNGAESQVMQAIDQLLIAHAKDQFNWQKIEQEQDLKYIPEYRGSLLTGKLSNKLTKEPASAILTYLSVPGKNVHFYAAKSKNDGSLIFELKDFYGNNEIVVQNDYTKDKIYSIDVDNPFSQEYAKINIPEFNLEEQMENWIKRQSQNMQIENANKKFQPQLPLLTKVDSLGFYNEPDSRYYLDDFTRFIVMEEVMREYVYGVNVRKNKEGFHFMVIDLERREIYSENPLILLDGVPVFDADEIIALDPLKVEKIETVKRRFHKGLLDCRGIVTYTTYKGDLNGYALHKNALVFQYEGVQPKKQYYFPEYPSSFEKRITTPDFRNVLYWNPDINLDEKGNTSIEFYTSDDVNNYEIRITGLSKKGVSFSENTYLEVHQSNNN